MENIIELMEVGQKYQITFPRGDVSKVELKEKEMIGGDYHYVFAPLSESDRVFKEHENWQSLGWEEPWWFSLPEGILAMTDIRPLDEDNNPLSDQEIEYIFLQLKIEKAASITLEDINRNPRKSSEPIDELLNYSKKIELSDEMKKLVEETISEHVKKLKESMETT